MSWKVLVCEVPWNLMSLFDENSAPREVLETPIVLS